MLVLLAIVVADARSASASLRPTLLGTTRGGCRMATLGVETTDLSRVSRARWELPEGTYGALVIEVLPNSPASDAGIAVGDVITRVGSLTVQGYTDFIDAMYKSSCKEPTAIEVLRSGARRVQEILAVSAAGFYDQACSDGQPTGCYRTGWLKDSDSEGNLSREHARRTLRDACSQGSGAACDYLAHSLLTASQELTERRGLFERACALHDATGCVDLAFLYATGSGGVARDDAKATPLYVKGCDGGDPSGCYNVGLMYEKGRGVAVDLEVAFAAYVEGCEGRFPKACENLALLYQDGRGVKASATRAVEFHRRACPGDPEESDAAACVNLAEALQSGTTVPADPKAAAKLFASICDRVADPDDSDSAPQIARACSLLGAAYLDGLGVEASVQRAVELSERGCNGGNATGCFNLGIIYGTGEHLERDDKKAAGYFRRACDGDDAEACFELGRMTSNGLGVEHDDRVAAALYEKSCSGGDAKGCASLGDAYSVGAGVPLDAAKAVALLQKACDADLPEGCYNLANRYADGNGVPVDAARAAALYARACTGGLAEGCAKSGK